MKEMGGTIITVGEFGNSVHLTDNHSPILDTPKFTEEQWEMLAKGLNEMGELASKDGITLCFHHHLGTGVMKRDEIDKIMKITNPKFVKLLLDTGHCYAAGVDTVQVIKDYKDRIAHVHLKNIRDENLKKAISTKSTFFQQVKDGMFSAPGDETGSMNFDDIFQELANVSYKGKENFSFLFDSILIVFFYRMACC